MRKISHMDKIIIVRVLLSKTQIIVLDESNSFIEQENESKVQGANAFNGIPLLMIAHRVEPLMDSSKIMLMEQGSVADYASQRELLE